MFVFVWGTRVRDDQVGAVAMDCSGCCERTIADVHVLSEAQHVYFIAGAYKMVNNYVVCRLCGSRSALPSGAQPADAPPPEECVPAVEFVAETNPQLTHRQPPPGERAPEAADGVTVPQEAVLDSIAGALSSSDSSDRYSGYTGALGIAAIVGLVLLGIVLHRHVKDLRVFLPLLGLCGVAAFWPILALHSHLIRRTVTCEMGPTIRRFLGHFGCSVDELIHAAFRLGGRFRKAGRYLEKARSAFSGEEEP